MKVIIISCIIALLLLFLFYRNNEYLKRDYTQQPWLYSQSKKHWDAAHGFMRKLLADNPYITFNLRYRVTPAQTLIPGTFVQVNCKDRISKLSEIQKAWSENQMELSQLVKKYNNGKIRVSGGHHTFNDIS
ncbi:hypothetical protein LCGC14_1438990, partial [marine sediment metagenome]